MQQDVMLRMLELMSQESKSLIGLCHYNLILAKDIVETCSDVKGRQQFVLNLEQAATALTSLYDRHAVIEGKLEILKQGVTVGI